MSELKQVILMRMDLKLPKGKMAAQASHAAVTAHNNAEKTVAKKWCHAGMRKVVLKVASEKELYKFIQQAKDAGLATAVISDAGRTVVEPGTVTCGAIGPADEDSIDAITGELSMV